MKKIFCFIIIFMICSLFIFNNKKLKMKAEANEIVYVLNEEFHTHYLQNALSSNSVYNSNITNYHNNVTAYFDNLTYNLGMNYKGSCGYVGIGMLLSFYDTFLVDEIIPENYDIKSIGNSFYINGRRNSPGIYRDVIANPNDLTDSYYGASLSPLNYYNHMVSISNQSLHAKLITIGADKGYYNFNLANNNAGLSFTKIQDILTTYLSNVVMYEESDFSINYEDTNVRDFVISNVTEGIPVLLGITGSRGGHIVIAYDYDELTDNIYCHFGWGADKTHVTIESEYFTNYSEAFTLTINKSHLHSNNYGVTTINNNIATTNYYCYDYSEITLINHTYNYNYVSSGELSHNAYCKCGAFITESHIMFKGACSKCSYIHQHNFLDWIYYNNNYHIEVCDCGVTGTLKKPHVIRAIDVVNQKAPCLECGYIVDCRNDTGMLLGTNIKYSINGSLVLSNGIIILVDEDINDYFLGCLIFYKSNELPNYK